MNNSTISWHFNHELDRLPVAGNLTFFIHYYTREVDWFSLTGVILLLCLAPFIVFFFIMACDQYQCSISLVLLDIYNGDASPLSILKQAPSFTWTAAKIYGSWVTFQVKMFILQQWKWQYDIVIILYRKSLPCTVRVIIWLVSPRMIQVREFKRFAYTSGC